MIKTTCYRKIISTKVDTWIVCLVLCCLRECLFEMLKSIYIRILKLWNLIIYSKEKCNFWKKQKISINCLKWTISHEYNNMKQINIIEFVKELIFQTFLSTDLCSLIFHNIRFEYNQRLQAMVKENIFFSNLEPRLQLQNSEHWKKIHKYKTLYVYVLVESCLMTNIFDFWHQWKKQILFGQQLYWI